MTRPRMKLRVVAACVAIVGFTSACAPDATGPAPLAPTPLTALRTPPPAYPEALACDGIGGKVVLMLTIGTDGRVKASRVHRPSPSPLLDAAAQEAVKAWEFRAPTRNGQPVETPLEVPMTFNAPVERPQRCFVLDEQR